MALRFSSFPYFVLTALLLGPVAGRAADEAPAEPGPRMLYNHLTERCRSHFDRRRQAVAALKTPEDVRRRQDELRRRFWEALGERPERTPLNARVVGSKRCGGYRLERVVYESRPHHQVTAIFYIPEGHGPFPGVLVP